MIYLSNLFGPNFCLQRENALEFLSLHAARYLLRQAILISSGIFCISLTHFKWFILLFFIIYYSIMLISLSHTIFKILILDSSFYLINLNLLCIAKILCWWLANDFKHWSYFEVLKRKSFIIDNCFSSYLTLIILFIKVNVNLRLFLFLN